jgi:hypothetical protein
MTPEQIAAHQQRMLQLWSQAANAFAAATAAAALSSSSSSSSTNTTILNATQQPSHLMLPHAFQSASLAASSAPSSNLFASAVTAALASTTPSLDPAAASTLPSSFVINQPQTTFSSSPALFELPPSPQLSRD